MGRRRPVCRALVAAACGSLLFASAPLAGSTVLKTTAEWINTVGYEDSPFLSPDGTRLYFMYTPWSTWPVFYGLSPVILGPERIGHHINPDRNPWEDADLYVSTRAANGTWSTPQNLSLNDEQADCCAMTWDGVRFAYQRTQWPNSAWTDIYLAHRSADGRGWTRISAGSEVNGAQSSESNAHLSPDGTTLYFTSDRAGGFGGTDLYASRLRADGTWGEARNLGSRFNTAAGEDQIWVSRDGTAIYFNREPGPHILMSRWTGRDWSQPQVVRFGGAIVAGAEPSLTDDGRTLVFAEVRPDLEDIVIVQSRARSDGSWSAPLPIEEPDRESGGRVELAPNQRLH